MQFKHRLSAFWISCYRIAVTKWANLRFSFPIDPLLSTLYITTRLQQFRARIEHYYFATRMTIHIWESLDFISNVKYTINSTRFKCTRYYSETKICYHNCDMVTFSGPERLRMQTYLHVFNTADSTYPINITNTSVSVLSQDLSRVDTWVISGIAKGYHAALSLRASIERTLTLWHTGRKCS